MEKMKVHEIAKELNVKSNDVVAFLNEKGIDVKAAQSSIEADAADMVRKKFGKAPVEAPKATEEKKEAPKASAPAADAQDSQVKKKKIIFVNNPHNSKMPGQSQGTNLRRDGARSANNNQSQNAQPRRDGARPANNNNGQRTISGNAYTHNIIKPRPEALTRKHPDVVEPEEEVAVKPSTEEVKTTVNVVVEEAPKKEYLRRENNDRPNNGARRDGDRPFNKEGRRDGDRPFNREGRPQGDRPFNREGRPQGDRPFNREGRPQGDRPFNREGRPQGDRPFNKDGARRDGDRPFNREGGRPQGAGRGTMQSRPSFGDAPAMPGKPTNDRKDYSNSKNKNKNYDNTKDGAKNSNRRNQEKETRGNKNFLMQDDEETLAMKRKKGKFIKPEAKVVVEEEVIKVITLDETVTIKDLADKMKIQPAQIVKKLFLEGKIVTVNQEITFEEAENIAIDYEIICEKAVKVDVIEELLKEDDEDTENLVERPPVVCVMGHVDHGKTSLLDAIRKTRVTDKEAGGITQAIGAYTVHVKDRDITFLDTPGHEAFTAMRMRGANSTDIAVLVVAADDGVMPQTVEAINHAKAAGVEVIVAVNKIDKPAANPDKVKQELTEYELIPTDWGGSTEFVNISAKRGDGIDDLLETILLTADVLELKANPDRKARGLVIEAELDKGRGPVATVLVQKGTLKVGDFVSAGACNGKVRAMINDKGKSVKVAGPSIPVEILGLNDVPNAGEVFIAHDSDKTAKNYAETFIAQNKEKKLEEIKSRMSLDDLFSKIQEGNLKELNIIVKADVQGSVEAVKQSLTRLSNEEVIVKCIHGGVGTINESDVSLAGASNAIIIGFNVKTDPVAKATAEQEGVDIRLYKVIYQAIEDVEAAMKGMLDPVFEEKIIGHAEIRQIFKASAIGNIAGSYVLDGQFTKNCKVRITRAGEQIFEGNLSSLKRFKDDVKEVKAGFECGLVFEGFDKFEELDIVEAYTMVEVPR